MSFPGLPTLRMTDQEFGLIRDFIRDYCGIFFENGAKTIVEMRLSRNAEHLKVKSFLDYYYLLKYDERREQELQELVETVTTKETYFFREPSQLRAFSEEIVPDLIQRKRGRERAMRIWSAGCATGEEPYSVAILLCEDTRLETWKKEITANDISKRALQVCRAGLYGESSMRAIAPSLKEKYFERKEARYRLIDRARGSVQFAHVNLLDCDRISLLPQMDVIFCRNVIMYFHLEPRRKVVNTFFDKLVPGGYLLLGHAESLMNLSTGFEFVQLTNDLVYRKPL
ncbi:MAG: protein-glutamate O-methyltransferase CheR [Nitrospirae bacterium]|nr:protein-glutamate O-methyltransferase CheR [Nitrospirota bacterium]